ncbi:MAG TPA: RdgB/HAM1 family non-canonical purine NTP pyrophosphatase [Pyrinomonadaceae bacterium]|nr:RdgB/HAM1 family non-canonical purine NTP pyrophosphatase [Pyrinomonadaceae bacterium]
MSKHFQQLLIATGNAGKLAEFRRMLDGDNINIIGLDEFPDIVDVEETGATFAENAVLKAIGYAQQTGIAALADDSGLEVHSIGGRPGVHSARYLGDVSFEDRMESILIELAADGLDRSARFVSSIAIALPDGNIIEQVDGVCSGKIAAAQRGTNGFGYDPIFVPDGHELTFGELSDEIKDEISHRSDALRKIIPKIRGFTAY